MSASPARNATAAAAPPVPSATRSRQRCCSIFNNCELRKVSDYIGIPADDAALQARPAAGDQGRALLRPRLQPVHRLPPLPGGLQRRARRRLPGSQEHRRPHLGRHHCADAARIRLQVLQRLRHRLPDRRADGPHARRGAQGRVAGAVQGHLSGRHRRAALRAAGRPRQVFRGRRRGAREAALPRHPRPRLLLALRIGLPAQASRRPAVDPQPEAHRRRQRHRPVAQVLEAVAADAARRPPSSAPARPD